VRTAADLLLETIVALVDRDLSLVVFGADSLKDQVYFLGAVQVVAGPESFARGPFVDGKLQLASLAGLAEGKGLLRGIFNTAFVACGVRQGEGREKDSEGAHFESGKKVLCVRLVLILICLFVNGDGSL
jgi:hypothetical protein